MNLEELFALEEGSVPCECTECLGKVMGERIDTALTALRKERGAYYGDIRRNHESIGLIWAGILGQAVMAGRWAHGEPVPPEIVCLMMVGAKLSREAFRHKKDNVDDGKNYLDFASELAEEKL